MGGLSAEQEAQEQALARANALRESIPQANLINTGRFLVAPSWGDALSRAAAGMYAGAQQGAAAQALQGIPGRRQQVRLPGM
jgi:hypothetical protein